MLRGFALVSSILSVLAISNFAQAITLKAQDLRVLPTIQVAGVEVDNGPMFAAVQPTAFLRVNYSSCAQMQLDATTEEQSGVLFVTVVLPPGQVDCMGPVTSREYSLQISSDFRHSVVVLNPVKRTVK